MKKFYYLFLFMLSVEGVFSQGTTSDSVAIAGHYYKVINHNDDYLSLRNFNRTLNRLFGQIAVGAYHGSDLANYATIEPVNGNFAFNGYGALFSNDSTRHPVYINLNIKGALVGTSSTEIFSNSKLNTNTSVTLKLHFGISNRTITYLNDDASLINSKRDSLFKNALFQLQKAKAIAGTNQEILALNQLKGRTLENKLGLQRAHYQGIASLVRYHSNGNSDTLAKYVDSAMKISAAIELLVADSFKLSRHIDSLTDNQALINSHLHNSTETRFAVKQYFVTKDNYERQIDSVELKAPLNRVHLFWKTATIGFSRQKYYTYNEMLPYSSRINKQVLDALEVGLAINYFWENFKKGNVFYANLGVSRRKDNNTAGLSTTEISEEKSSDSASVKRKFSNKYNVYTDPIVEYRNWLGFVNAHYMWGKRDKSGIHFIQEFDFRKSQKLRLNSGIGYIFSFTDKKDNKSILNVEAYVKFMDIGKVEKDQRHFYSRNSIGINVGLPFNYIL